MPTGEPASDPSLDEVPIVRVANGAGRETAVDTVAVEEPLEIRVGFEERGQSRHQAVSITMRTPGNDFELAAGFLFTEGILHAPAQIAGVRHCGREPNRENTVRVDLVPGVVVDIKRLERNFYTTSSCGVCGKTSLQALATGARKIEDARFKVESPLIDTLPRRLRASQGTFDRTGGLHAAGLFSIDGELLAVREDVGRHNAVDKLVGARLLAGRLPERQVILMLSGRASFELLQKAVMAGIPMVCAVGAPSSLAIAAAKEFGVSLLGFVRDNRFNVYAGEERLA